MTTHVNQLEEKRAGAKSKSSWLRNALRGNAVFSTLSGLLFLLDSGPVAEFIGFANPSVLMILGIVLLAYVPFLLYAAANVEEKTWMAWVAIELDVLWVVGSAVLLLTGWLGLNTVGNWAVLIVADVVAVFAGLQYYGLRRMK